MSNHLTDAARRMFSRTVNADMYVSAGTKQAEDAQRFEGDLASINIAGGQHVCDSVNVSPAMPGKAQEEMAIKR